jgi:hypothetical protein
MTETIVLLRSGRHVRLAIESLTRRFPGARVVVVGQPASVPLLEMAGVTVEDQILYDGGFFTPWKFYRSDAGKAVRQSGFTRMAVLWYDPDGVGQGNVNRTALILAPRGYLAVAPDGSIIERYPQQALVRQAVRAVCSVAAMAAIGTLLYAPAAIGRLVTGRSRS